jgi:hypothetical protein
VLQWRSQETNTKLRALAEQFIADVRALSGDRLAHLHEYDRALVTAHERVEPPSDLKRS